VHVLTPLGPASEHLSDEQKKTFDAIRQSAPGGLLGAIDRFLVEILVEHLALHERAARELAGQELVYESDGRCRTNPLAEVVSTQATVIIKLVEALALTPAGRQRIRTPEPGGAWNDVAG
jgi:phage terminase small subunit